jgi:hypothetical protein
MMRTYARNSPEASARVLVMLMMVDARIEDGELEVLDRVRAFELLGLSRRDFASVLQAYCADLPATGAVPGGRVRLVSREVIDAVCEPVQEPRLRLLTSALALNVLDGDGDLAEAELAVFQRVLWRWGYTLDALEQRLTNLPGTRSQMQSQLEPEPVDGPAIVLRAA